jgi:hypothetical protein
MTFEMCNEVQRVKKTTYPSLSLSLSRSPNLATSVNSWFLKFNQLLQLNPVNYNNVYDRIVELKASDLVESFRRFGRACRFYF